jgi:glycolate oxidase subunit GlcD
MHTDLINELVQVVGPEWVLTQPGDLYTYSFDAALDRALPSAVILPANPGQLAKVVETLAKHKHPYVARGAATSLAGGPVPLKNAAVIALARLNRINKIDVAHREARVEPGVVNLKLHNAVEQHGLFYPPDPGSQKACTLGGNVATNAGGPHCLKYGVTSNFVTGLEMVMADGKPAFFNVDDPGYDVVGLLVGSEGTLGIAARLHLRLIPKPLAVRTMVVSFRSLEEAIQTVTDIIAAGIIPATLEAMDKTVIQAVEAFIHAGYPLEAEAVLLIEVDGNDQKELDEQVLRIRVHCLKNNAVEFRFARDEADRQKLWEGRRGAYAAMARLAPNVLVEDGAVPRTKLPEALRAIKDIAEEEGLRVALLFHAGDGNLHPQIIFDERDVEHTKVVKEAGYRMLKACVDLGGTISGEHGIGVDKREAMRWLFTRETLMLFRRIKNAFDPNNLCNPDKLIPLVSKSSVEDEVVTDPAKLAKSGPLGFAEAKDEAEMVATVKAWAKERKPFGIQGRRTKYTVNEHAVMGTSCLNRLLDFDPGNLTVTVQGGVLLTEVRTFVEKSKLYLWVAGEGTVGGTVATRASVAPPLRDQILGMRVLLSNGDIVKFGASTMKNVAGYDAARLLIGSWGTLGIILDVTFRLFPFAAPAPRTGPVKPFVFRDVHKKVKSAFDPLGILSPRMLMVTGNAEPTDSDKLTTAESGYKPFEERFWKQ